jgi:hypothetical protein
MEAGASSNISTPVHHDIFDRIGDALGNAARSATHRYVDEATILSPAFAATRAVVDPAGTKAAYQHAHDAAVTAATLVSPTYALARFFGTDTGKHLAQVGADAAVKAAKGYVESPLTGYGLFKHVHDYAASHPDTVARAAKTGFNVATLTNPGIALARGWMDAITGD